jgi:hypothetical protein
LCKKKQSDKNGKTEIKPATGAKSAAAKPEEEDVSERLRIARQYFNTAPKPHFPVTKYDVYEQ